MTDSTIHASDIQQAQARISSEIAPTPLQYCARLSAETGCEVYLKREDLQDVRSYKIRGALNGMSNVPQEERGRGIVTASAGNHAQGVAYACRTMGIAGLGGATLDNEENYLIKKLFTAAGAIQLENQARI